MKGVKGFFRFKVSAVAVLVLVSVVTLAPPAAPAPSDTVEVSLGWPFEDVEGWTEVRGSGAHVRTDAYAQDWDQSLRDALGDPVLSAVTGRVIFSDLGEENPRPCDGNKPNYGRQVIIEFGDGYALRYAHLATATVADGATVSAGDPVGTVGESGLCESGTSHLHAVVYRNIHTSERGCTNPSTLYDYLQTGSNPRGGCKAYATPFEFSSEPKITVAGGTWFDRRGGMQGTAFTFPATIGGVSNYVIEVAGPAGWNNGLPLAVSALDLPGLAPDRTMFWTLADPLTGSYTAGTVINGTYITSDFSVDASTTLPAPEITSVAVQVSTISLQWDADRSAKSFFVAAYTTPWPGSLLTGQMVDGNKRRWTFPFSFASGEYQLVVWAYPEDLTEPGPYGGTTFNIASDFRIETVP